MNVDKLYQLIEDPSLLSRETLPELKQLTEKYPYFQTARILYLKNLAILEDVNFVFELKKMAIYITDRKHLFTFIEGEKYGLEDGIKEGLIETSQKDSFELIDSFLSSQGDDVLKDLETETSLLFTPSTSADYLHWAISKHTTTETKETEDESSPKLQHQDLIDSFIKEDEQRVPGSGLRFNDDDDDYIDDYYLEELEEKKADADSEASDGDSYFTETLAQIYIKQKRYDKALQIIKSLSLKYPEKNVYFADQIRFLEKLIINTIK